MNVVFCPKGDNKIWTLFKSKGW